MAYAALEAPLQAFAGDTTDPLNSALWGVRCADRPNTWANWKAYGVVDGITPRLDTDEAGNVIGATWVGLWPGADLRIVNGGHKVEKWIVINERSASTHYEFTLKLAGGHDAVQVGDTLSIQDPQGVERLSTRTPWARDSATTAGTADGRNYYPATLTRMGNVGNLARYAIDIRAEDLASAVLPLEIEPTTTISGTANIQDALINGNGPDNNYGGWDRCYLGGNDAYKTLVRVNKTQIPSGSLTGFRFFVYPTTVSVSPFNAVSYAVKDANNWVEGTASIAPQTGSCCWNRTAYNTTSWAGSAGCGTSGTDYDADSSPPSSDLYPASAFHAITLKPAWATAWRDDTRTNNGALLRHTSSATAVFQSTENSNSAQTPYVEIDYALGGAASMLARRIHE
jgi:hypothetical protein